MFGISQQNATQLQRLLLLQRLQQQQQQQKQQYALQAARVRMQPLHTFAAGRMAASTPIVPLRSLGTTTTTAAAAAAAAAIAPPIINPRPLVAEAPPMPSLSMTDLKPPVLGVLQRLIREYSEQYRRAVQNGGLGMPNVIVVTIYDALSKHSGIQNEDLPSKDQLEDLIRASLDHWMATYDHKVPASCSEQNYSKSKNQKKLEAGGSESETDNSERKTIPGNTSHTQGAKPMPTTQATTALNATSLSTHPLVKTSLQASDTDLLGVPKGMTININTVRAYRAALGSQNADREREQAKKQEGQQPLSKEKQLEQQATMLEEKQRRLQVQLNLAAASRSRCIQTQTAYTNELKAAGNHGAHHLAVMQQQRRMKIRQEMIRLAVLLQNMQGSQAIAREMLGKSDLDPILRCELANGLVERQTLIDSHSAQLEAVTRAEKELCATTSYKKPAAKPESVDEQVAEQIELNAGTTRQESNNTITTSATNEAETNTTISCKPSATGEVTKEPAKLQRKKDRKPSSTGEVTEESFPLTMRLPKKNATESKQKTLHTPRKASPGVKRVGSEHMMAGNSKEKKSKRTENSKTRKVLETTEDKGVDNLESRMGATESDGGKFYMNISSLSSTPPPSLRQTGRVKDTIAEDRKLTPSARRLLKNLAPHNGPGKITKDECDFRALLQEDGHLQWMDRRSRRIRSRPNHHSYEDNFRRNSSRKRKRPMSVHMAQPSTETILEHEKSLFQTGETEQSKRKTSKSRNHVEKSMYKKKRKKKKSSLTPDDPKNSHCGDRKAPPQVPSAKKARKRIVPKPNNKTVEEPPIVPFEALSQSTNATPPAQDAFVENLRSDGSIPTYLPPSVQKALKHLAPHNVPGSTTAGDNAFIIDAALYSSSRSLRKSRRQKTRNYSKF